MKVSIIVPVYNAEKHIERCIKSVINQSYKDIEIILVNDGSDDNSLNICKKYSIIDKRIKVINKKNGGVSSARNEGIKMATGDYIVFVDSDDYIETDLIKCGIELVKTYNPDMIKFNFFKEANIIKLKNKFYIQTDELLNSKIDEIKKNIFKTDNFCTCWGTMFKTNIAKLIKFNENIRVGEDFIFVVTYLCKSNSVYVSTKYMYHYIVNEDSTTHLYNLQKNIEKLTEAIKANILIEEMLFDKELFNKNLPRLVKSRRNILAFVNICIDNTNYKEFIIAIKKYKSNSVINNELNLLKNYFNVNEKKLLMCNFWLFVFYKIKLTIKKIIKRIM